MANEHDSVPLREYLDALDHARERAQDMAAAEREKSAAILRTPVETTDVSLRSYLEALRTGDQRALDMAAEERSKAAEVLRDEQRRALTVAQEEREKAAQALSAGTDRAIADNFARLSEQFKAYEKYMDSMFNVRDTATEVAAIEREKAAKALRDGLERTIAAGDERLREHISNQIEQIRAALKSSDELEKARINSVAQELRAKLQGSSDLFAAIQGAAEKAVAKAENAQKIVNETQNEFRGTLSDQNAQTMPRKEAEANKADQDRINTELRGAIAELSKLVAVGPSGLSTLQSRFDTSSGAKSGGTDARAGIYTVLALILTVAIIISPHIK